MKRFKNFKLHEENVDPFKEENWDEEENNDKLYISNQMATCPVCNGPISYDGQLQIDPDPNFVYYNWVCDDCGFNGMETYELVFRTQSSGDGDINVGDVVDNRNFQ